MNANDAGVNAKPILVQMAAENPDSTISVIVQKSVRYDRVEDAVAKLNATVTLDLSIINSPYAVS